MSDNGDGQTLDLDQITVDLEHLTVEEIEELEERTGQPFDILGQPDKPKAKFLRGIAYVMRRRVDPDFTWEQAGKLKVRLVGTPVPPTNAAG